MKSLKPGKQSPITSFVIIQLPFNFQASFVPLPTVCLDESNCLLSPGITVQRSVGGRALTPKPGPSFPAIVPSVRLPNTRLGCPGGSFSRLKKKMGWLAASDSGRFTAPNLFYLSRLSLIISCQETDNRGKEAFCLGQVWGCPKGFRGLQTTRPRLSHQVPLGSRLGVLPEMKQQDEVGFLGNTAFPWGP